jgi:hypothetical protein
MILSEHACETLIALARFARDLPGTRVPVRRLSQVLPLTMTGHELAHALADLVAMGLVERGPDVDPRFRLADRSGSPRE